MDMLRTSVACLLGGILFAVIGSSSGSAATSGKEQANKQLVTEFYDMAFNQRKPAEAAEKYLSKRYVQHNPFVADGPKPFVDFFVAYQKKHPEAHVDIKRKIAEGDYVVLHVQSQEKAKESGRAVIDIFRVIDGKITEHWDVGQPIPAKPANQNTMF